MNKPSVESISAVAELITRPDIQKKLLEDGLKVAAGQPVESVKVTCTVSLPKGITEVFGEMSQLMGITLEDLVSSVAETGIMDALRESMEQSVPKVPEVPQVQQAMDTFSEGMNRIKQLQEELGNLQSLVESMQGNHDKDD